MYLRNEKNSEILPIQCFHIFGRHPLKSDTTLAHPSISQIHASIAWNGNLWEIVDHSRNGTFINYLRIKSNVELPLCIGQKIAFGSFFSHCWVVENLDPPQLNTHYDLITIPLATHRATCRNASNDRLYVPNSTEIKPIKTRFDFYVSQNEEHVKLHVKLENQMIDLGERAHHYSLLILARHRADDASRGIDPSSQGWVSMPALSSMLGLTQTHVNMQIFRAKEQFLHQLPQPHNTSAIIERRRGEIRFAEFPLEIKHGSAIETSFQP